jgi:hypothetical protein
MDQCVDAVGLIGEVVGEELNCQSFCVVGDGQAKARGDQGRVWGRDTCSTTLVGLCSSVRGTRL